MYVVHVCMHARVRVCASVHVIKQLQSNFEYKNCKIHVTIIYTLDIRVAPV